MRDPIPQTRTAGGQLNLWIGIGAVAVIAALLLFGWEHTSKIPATYPRYVEDVVQKPIDGKKESVQKTPRQPCNEIVSEAKSVLCAQWMATYAALQTVEEARNATFFAKIGIFVGIMTVVGLFVTIRQAAGANEEAQLGNRIAAAANEDARRRAEEGAADTARALAASERAAAAADKQVEVSTGTAKKQLRAYLHIRRITFSDFENYPLDIGLQAENYGVTPAYNAKLYVAFDIWEPASANPNFAEPEFMDGISSAPVTKEHPFIFRVRPWDDKFGNDLTMQKVIFEEVRTGVLNFGLRGRLTYTDIFGDPHTTHFHVKLGKETGMQMLKDPLGPGSYFAVAYNPTGNDAD